MQLLNKLKYWLQPIDKLFEDFSSFTEETEPDFGNNRRIFIDNGGHILFVAHLDTVLPPKFVRETKRRLCAIGLDDRLGCLLAYELGIELRADILLTDDEESCRSTAFFHDCKDYKWIIEFDRRGDDVVAYDKSSKDFLQKLADYWKIGVGSYSDICDLETKACCFNLGIGIKNGHQESCFVDKKILRKQIRKFRSFYKKYHDTEFVADKRTQSGFAGRVHEWGWLEQSYTQTHDPCSCDVCGGMAGVEYVHNYLICEHCFLQMFDSFMNYSDYDYAQADIDMVNRYDRNRNKNKNQKFGV